MGCTVSMRSFQVRDAWKRRVEKACERNSRMVTESAIALTIIAFFIGVFNYVHRFVDMCFQ